MLNGLRNWFTRNNIDPQGFIIASVALLFLGWFVTVGCYAALVTLFG